MEFSENDWFLLISCNIKTLEIWKLENDVDNWFCLNSKPVMCPVIDSNDFLENIPIKTEMVSFCVKHLDNNNLINLNEFPEQK